MTSTDRSTPGAERCLCHSSNDPQPGQTEPEVLVTPPFPGYDKLVSIDACIAGTIQRLWDADIHTLNSCCGHGEAPPSVVIDGHAVPQQGRDAGARATAVIAEEDSRPWRVLSWLLTDVGGASPAPTGAEDDELVDDLLGVFRAQLPYSALDREEVAASPLFDALVQLIKGRERQTHTAVASIDFEGVVADAVATYTGERADRELVHMIVGDVVHAIDPLLREAHRDG